MIQKHKENILPHKKLSGSMKRKRKVTSEELSASLFKTDNLSNISIRDGPLFFLLGKGGRGGGGERVTFFVKECWQAAVG